MSNLKVTCYLQNGFIGEAPHLDSLLQYVLAFKQGKAHLLDKRLPAPEVGDIPIPLMMNTIGKQKIYCCSSPIYKINYTSIIHIVKNFDFDSKLLAEKERKTINHCAGPYKSKRVPYALIHTEKIVWFASGNGKEIRRLLKEIDSIGGLRHAGYGLIDKWEVESIEQDYNWFAESEIGIVLMRPLPNCNDLPNNLLGYKKWYGACQAPYWHPDRYMEIVIPC